MREPEIPQCSGLLPMFCAILSVGSTAQEPISWYPSLYAPRTGGAYDSHHRTAGIAGRARRRGGCVRAQQTKPPIIEFMGESTPEGQRQWVAAFAERLIERGWTEGRNITIEYRRAEMKCNHHRPILWPPRRCSVCVRAVPSRLSVVVAGSPSRHSCVAPALYQPKVPQMTRGLSRSPRWSS